MKIPTLYPLLLTLLFTCGVFNALQGQESNEKGNCDSGYCWGQDPGEAKRQHALFADAYKYDQYQKAIAPMEWLLENTPFLHENLYIKGKKIYHTLIDQEKDEALLTSYKQKVLSLYDQQAEYFGDSAALMNRKGFYLFNYKVGDKDYQGLFDSYLKIFELNAEDTYSANLYILMTLVNLQYRFKRLTDAEVLSYYDNISAAIEANVEEATDKAEKQKWLATQEKIDDKLASTIVLDCDYVRNNMAEKIRNQPEDIKTMRKAVGYMMRAKCQNDPLYLIAAQNLYAQEPSLSLAESIYKQHMNNKDYEQAVKWLDNALDLSDDKPEKKAEILLTEAKIFSVEGKRNKARDLAYQAVSTHAASAAEAYVLIGDLYFNSSNVCDNSNPVLYRVIFLAAYDMYEKAGNQQAMQRASQQFPSAAEIHTAGYEQGQQIEVGCWIGGTTTLRKRGS